MEYRWEPPLVSHASIRLADVGQAGAVLVEPGQEVHSGADLLPGP
jgi:hypothetical protein